MKIFFRCISYAALALAIAACTTDMDRTSSNTPPPPKASVLQDQGGGQMVPIPTNPAPVSNEPVGGKIARNMDSLDKTKLIRALDKGTGKTTEWNNPITQTDYAVTPVRKVVVNGNSCRQYKVVATRGDAAKEFTGTACIGADGNWQQIDN